MNHIIGNNSSEKQLIDQILRGDNRAFESVIKSTERLVARIVFKLIPVAEDRKDLAQDIYLKAFNHLPGFKFQSKLSTWIARIAYNSCLSWLEKKKLSLPGNLYEENEFQETYQNQSFDSCDGERMLFQKELTGILNFEIERLSPVYQTLITLYHHESMSYEELSQITGLPAGTVKSSLFRARKILKENLLSKYQKQAL